MNTTNPRAAIFIVIFFHFSSAKAADLRIGIAQVEITPPLGTPMAGYYSERAASGIHDPLHAKCIVIESDGVKAALVSLDLIRTHREFVQEARRLVAETAGIPGSHVMISATHAHTGPILSEGSGRAAAFGGDRDLARAYTATLPRMIAEAVKQAHARLTPAKVSTARGYEDSLPFNRRFHMKDGSVGWNPGRLNPNILRPAGPIDPDVPVIYFATLDDRPLATYVNFSMHLDTVGGLEISADYPYTLARLLGDVKGPDMLTMFTLGSAGDINHINVRWKAQPKGHAEAARIGTILAGSVLRAYPQLQPAAASPLECRSTVVQLPLADFKPGDVRRARDTLGRRGKSEKEPSFLEVVDAFKVLDVHERGGKPLDVEVQVITLGTDIAFVSLPGEIFVELGMAIKRASPFKFTIIAQLTNGSIGYVPTRQAWTQGNYEVVSARCAPGSGELLVETASRLLREASVSFASGSAGR